MLGVEGLLRLKLQFIVIASKILIIKMAEEALLESKLIPRIPTTAIYSKR